MRVTGVTISREQLDYARARLQRAGLADRVDLQFRDYRDIEGRYDHIVSIEMIEAVGERYWPDYFAALKRHVGARRLGDRPGDRHRRRSSSRATAVIRISSRPMSSPAACCCRPRACASSAGRPG